MTYLTDAPLEGALLQALLDETANADAGALVVFGGTVRFDGRVQAIDYSAYAPLAIKTLRELEAAALARFAEVKAVRIVHREGLLKVGELSVLVVLRSAHRAQGFEAAAWVMDTLKKRVPVWKQEHYTDGSKEFLEGTPLSRS